MIPKHRGMLTTDESTCLFLDFGRFTNCGCLGERAEMRLQVSCDCPLSPRNRFSKCRIFPRGERARVRGNFTFVLQLRLTINRSAPLIRPPATFSPDLGGEGTCERLPSMASILNAHGIHRQDSYFSASDSSSKSRSVLSSGNGGSTERS